MSSSLPRLLSDSHNRKLLQCSHQNLAMNSSSAVSFKPKHIAIISEFGAPAPVPEWGGYYVSQTAVDCT